MPKELWGPCLGGGCRPDRKPAPLLQRDLAEKQPFVPIPPVPSVSPHGGTLGRGKGTWPRPS